MKPTAVSRAVEACMQAGRPCHLWGPPGVGKSQVVWQLADRLGAEVLDIRALLLDPVDLRGLPHVADNVTTWAPPVFLPRDDRPRILFLDELSAAPPLMQAACYGLVLDRKLGEYRLPDNTYVMAAGNRESDRAVVSRMSTALANRFVHVDFEVDTDDWVRWASGAGVRTEVIAFIRYRPNLLHDFDPKRHEKAFPSPRSWAFVSDLLGTASAEIEYDLLAGVVGQGAAAEIIGFLKIFRSLPDPDEILRSPATADAPDDPATLYAICGTLAARATKKNFGRVLKYAARLPVEFSVLLVRDAVNRDRSLVETRPFIEWTTANADVLL